MPQLYLRTSDIDSITYTEANTQAKPEDDFYGEKGFVNEYRSQMIFRNVDLYSAIGYKYDKQTYFTIKLKSITCHNESQTSVICETSPACLRCSNVQISGLDWLDGNGKRNAGIVSNYNPSTQDTYNVSFHRGDLGDYQCYWHRNPATTVSSCDFVEFYNRFLLPYNTNQAMLAVPRFNVFIPTDPNMQNKIVTFNSAVPQFANDPTSYVITTWSYPNNDGAVRLTAINKQSTITPVPPVQKWFTGMVSRDNDITEEDINPVLCFRRSNTNNIDITIELADLLTNQLQPIVPEPNAYTYPAFIFEFDINPVPQWKK